MHSYRLGGFRYMILCSLIWGYSIKYLLLIFTSSSAISADTTYSALFVPSRKRGLLIVFQVSAPKRSNGTGRVKMLSTHMMITQATNMIKAKTEKYDTF